MPCEGMGPPSQNPAFGPRHKRIARKIFSNLWGDLSMWQKSEAVSLPLSDEVPALVQPRTDLVSRRAARPDAALACHLLPGTCRRERNH